MSQAFDSQPMLPSSPAEITPPPVVTSPFARLQSYLSQVRRRLLRREKLRLLLLWLQATGVCGAAVLLLAACAHGVGSEPPAGNHATAQRIYMVAEERYAAGDFEAAVDLMRHALLQLPPSPEHDHLRHELILRMGHTQLRSSAASGQAAPLVDAQQMLTRYLERHEELFGENAVARAERGEHFVRAEPGTGGQWHRANLVHEQATVQRDLCERAGRS